MPKETLKQANKSQAHGQIGEAVVVAKCWMHGLRAYRTAALATHFANADIVVAAENLPHRPAWIEVKTGYPAKRGQVYLTQYSSDGAAHKEKFGADVVVFVNIEPGVGRKHKCDGLLDFTALSCYVVPRAVANSLFMRQVKLEAATPKANGEPRSMRNLAVHASVADMEIYREAWHHVRHAATGAA